MNNRKKLGVRLGAFLTVIVILFGLFSPSEQLHATNEEVLDSIACDVKLVSLRTNIKCSDEVKEFSITGNWLYILTDPMKIKDIEGNVYGQITDRFKLLTNNSHLIVLNDKVEVEMSTKFDLLHDQYELTDADGNDIGSVKFNVLGLNGAWYDAQGKLVATFEQKYLLRDFVVKVYQEDYDHETIASVFAAYVGDKAKTERNQQNNSNNNNNS